MPLLDIATAHPYLFSFRSQSLLYHNHHATFVIGNESATASWRYFSISDKHQRWGQVERRWRCGVFVVKAVATVEPKLLAHKDGKIHLGIDSTATEDSEDVDDKELLRRERISKANAGKRPWNKGRKHSPETLQRIRERTRLAMQNPKIRMKLQSLGHAQSEETKLKIGDGVRIKWQKRNEMNMLQETCRFEWENLVAEASRKGFCGEEELQWNSYQILEEELRQEWLDSVRQRKDSPAARGNKRAPKSLEQRRKISAAIAAKWADPEYRSRVSYGLTKYHGSHGRVGKPIRKAPSDEKPKTKSPANKPKPAINVINMQNEPPKFKRSKGPSYKDPLASSKFEMLKNIRAQRAAAESNKCEAITRAKLLIAEAQKAAQALEIAAASSPLAQASLIETRKLIAEAMGSIGSIDPEYPFSDQIGKSSSFTSSEPLNHVEHEPDLELEASTITIHEKVNGFKTLDSSHRNFFDYDFSNISQDLLDSLYDDDDDDGDDDDDFELTKLELEHMITHPSFTKQFGGFIPNGADQTEIGEVISQQFVNIEPDGDGDQESKLPYHLANIESENEKNQPKPETKTKKWVRGKLVEVEGD